MPKRFKSKQNYIDDFLTENLSVNFVYDKAIEGGCSKRRPDWLIDMLTHSIIIECDENQHTNYSCDNKRTMELFTDLGNRPLIMIRFNPDKYKINDNVINGCFKFNKSAIVPTEEWGNRKGKLVETIEYYIKNIPNKEVTTEMMYFNTDEEEFEYEEFEYEEFEYARDEFESEEETSESEKEFEIEFESESEEEKEKEEIELESDNKR